MLTVGMVVEGSHDYIMLKPFVEKQIASIFGDTVQLLDLQPTMDATGKYADGGWSKVVAWCLRNSGEQLQTFFTPLFGNQTACDFIIIHLDGDAVELIAPHTGVAIPKPPYTPSSRCDLLALAIAEWLDISPELSSKIAFATPVLQTEAWIIGAEDSHPDPESIDAKAHFRSGFNFKKEKLSAYYSKKAAAVVPNLERARVSCASYDKFAEKMESLTK